MDRSTWGHVRFEVHADGDFINLPQTVFTEADFQDDHCEILYRIDGMHLHQGRNLGAVWITSMRQRICVPVEVLTKTARDMAGAKLSANIWSCVWNTSLDYTGRH